MISHTINRILLIQLLDIIIREETLHNVIKSVTRNWRSIALTALLALILVYLFSIIGFTLFRNDYVFEVDPPLASDGEYQYIS